MVGLTIAKADIFSPTRVQAFRDLANDDADGMLKPPQASPDAMTG